MRIPTSELGVGARTVCRISGRLTSANAEASTTTCCVSLFSEVNHSNRVHMCTASWLLYRTQSVELPSAPHRTRQNAIYANFVISRAVTLLPTVMRSSSQVYHSLTGSIRASSAFWEQMSPADSIPTNIAIRPGSVLLTATASSGRTRRHRESWLRNAQMARDSAHIYSGTTVARS